MDKISFLLNNNVVYTATVTKISETVIKLTFSENIPEESILLSGFEILNENNNNNMTGNFYHGYTTLYKSIDSRTVLLSNDDSVYSPDSDDEIIEPAPEPVEPHIPTLDETKEEKILELSDICRKSVTDGVYVEIDGNTEHFSYTDEDQINIKELFDLVIQTNLPVYYHADGENCKSYTPKQITAIYSAAAINKLHHMTYFNQLKMYILSLDTIDSVNNVVYGQELSGEYLATCHNAMEQAKSNINALLANFSTVSNAPTE